MARITGQALIISVTLLSLFPSVLSARSRYYLRYWESERRQVAEPDWVLHLRPNSFFNRRSFQFSTPAVHGDKLFVGVHRNLFYAIQRDRGKKIWKFRTHGPVHAPARADNTQVYFADLEGLAYALDQENGKPVWITSLGSEVMSAPLLTEDRIYFVTVDKEIFCLNPATGAILWQVAYPAADFGFTVKGSATPVRFRDQMLVGFSDGVVAAYSLKDGSLRWVRQVGDPLVDQKDVDAEVLLRLEDSAKDVTTGYITSADGRLIAFRPENGEVLWEAPFGGTNNLALAGPHIYVTARGIVYCLNAANGEALWEQDLAVSEVSQPAVYQDYLAVIATRGQAYFLDRNKGDLVYSWHIHGGSFADPLQVEKTVYLLSNSGRLYAFRYKK